MGRVGTAFFLPLVFVIFNGLQVTAATAASHRSTSGWLTFEYPDGWEVVETEKTRTRYVENVGVQPRGQDFSGRDGEYALRVFDPLYVYDEVVLPSNAPPEQVFRTFVRGLPGEAGASFFRDSEGGATVYVARSLLDGVHKAYFAQQAPNGLLMVAGGAAAKSSATQLERLLREVLRSTRFSAPAGSNMGPTNAVAGWYSALSRGDTASIRALTCANAKFLQDLIGVFSSASDMPDLSDAMIQSGRAFDRSGLRFFSLTYREEIASVRVSGPVVRPNGTVVPFYKSAQTFGSNVLVVRKEPSGWKVCEPLRGGRR